jgi:hypothetical protein
MFKSRDIFPQPMMTRKSTLLAMFAPLLVAPLTSDAVAQRGRGSEQDAAMAATKLGVIRPLRQIESQIVPSMRSRGANYIGAEFDSGLQRYRLKFMRDASVIWVDVDGKSGAVIAQAGN